MALRTSLSNNLVDFSRKSKILEKNEEFYHIEKWRKKRDSKSLQVILNAYLRLAISHAKKFKNYGWKTNYGYGTKEHLIALKKFGITKHHRKTFSPLHKI